MMRKKKQATNTHECLRHTIHCYCWVQITICLRLNSSAEFCSASMTETLNKAFYLWQYFTRQAFLLITLSVTQSSHTQTSLLQESTTLATHLAAKFLQHAKATEGSRARVYAPMKPSKTIFASPIFFFFFFWKNVQRHLICLPLQLAGNISTCFKSPIHGY